MASDYTLNLGEVTLGVRESGAPGGLPVLHFHGTPGSRLEMAWADDAVAQAGVHLVVFDRPGYGCTTPLPFSLSQVARLGIDLADHLGWQRFATSGWSGGGPFALATAAQSAERVSAVGIMSGGGPFQQVPGELDRLSGEDANGAALLSSDREAAAAAFASTFADWSDVSDEEQLLAAFAPVLSARDRRVLARPPLATALLRDIREAFRQGLCGGGWDNVAQIGEWDFSLDSVRCPVSLWYGDNDLMVPPAVGYWLADNLPDGRLTMRQGYGHLAPFEHLSEMLAQLYPPTTGC